MKTRTETPTQYDEAFRLDVIRLLDKHTGTLPADRMLAISANLVGQIVAMQDQRTMTPEMCMEIVSRNITEGNKDVIDRLNVPMERSS